MTQCIYITLHSASTSHDTVHLHHMTQCIYRASSLGPWVRRGCTRFQIPCFLCLKEQSFPSTIGISGSRLPKRKSKKLYQFFEFRNYPDAYRSNSTNPRLTHTTSDLRVSTISDTGHVRCRLRGLLRKCRASIIFLTQGDKRCSRVQGI